MLPLSLDTYLQATADLNHQVDTELFHQLPKNAGLGCESSSYVYRSSPSLSVEVHSNLAAVMKNSASSFSDWARLCDRPLKVFFSLRIGILPWVEFVFICNWDRIER